MVDGTSAALVYKVFSFQFSVFSRALSRPVQSPHVPRSVRSRGKALCFSPNPFPASARKAGLFADTPLNSHGLQNSKKLHSPPFEAAHPGFAGAAGTFWKPCAPHIPMLAPDGAPRFSAARIVVLFNFIHPPHRCGGRFTRGRNARVHSVCFLTGKKQTSLAPCALGGDRLALTACNSNDHHWSVKRFPRQRAANVGTRFPTPHVLYVLYACHAIARRATAGPISLVLCRSPAYATAPFHLSSFVI